MPAALSREGVVWKVEISQIFSKYLSVMNSVVSVKKNLVSVNLRPLVLIFSTSQRTGKVLKNWRTNAISAGSYIYLQSPYGEAKVQSEWLE